jgi:hypothetical protein
MDAPVVPTSTPTAAAPEPSLWFEYRDTSGYGLALPCFWHVLPPPPEAQGGTPLVASYDELFAMAHSVRGHWIDGKWPPGAVKMDLIILDDVDAELSLEDAVRSKLTEDDIQSIEPVLLGENHGVAVYLGDQPGQPAGSNVIHVVRLSPSSLLLLSVLPRQALDTPTVQGILASLALSPDETVTLPTFQPDGPVEGREAYVHAEAGYCLQYPSEYTLQEHASSQPAYVGQVANLEVERPLYRVGLAVEVSPVAAGSELDERVDAFLSRFDDQAGVIRREPGRLGGEPAVIVEGSPGREGEREVFALHENRLYHLSFVPSSTDFEQALADLEALFWIVSGSFSYLPEQALAFQPPPTELCHEHLRLSVRQGEAEAEAVATSFRCHSAFIDSTGRSPSDSAGLTAKLGTPIEFRSAVDRQPTEIDLKLYPGAGLSATFMRWPEDLPAQTEPVDSVKLGPGAVFQYRPQVPAGPYSLVARISWGEDIVVYYALNLSLEASSAAPEGSVPGATPSPGQDGVHVVYAREGKLWLWEEGRGAGVLTDVGEASDFKLSDDGQFIAFVRGVELWAIRVDGGDERLLVGVEDLAALVEPGDPGVRLHQFEWVPGTHVVAYGTRADLEIGLAPLNDLHLVDADTGEKTVLLARGEGGQFTYSPNGRQIAVVRSGIVVLVDAEGGNPRQVLTYTPPVTYSEFQYLVRPAWAEDASSLRVVVPPADPLAQPPQLGTVWHLYADGSSPRLLTTLDAGMLDSNAFSPDLRYIAYPESAGTASHDSSDRALLITDLESGGTTTYARGVGQVYGWAPDSWQFAFLTRALSPQAQIGGLGVEPRPVHDDPEIASIDVRWLEDGRYFYTTVAANGWTLYLAGDGGRVQVATVAGRDLSYDFYYGGRQQ